VALKYIKKRGDTQILKGRCSCKEEYDVHATYISTLPSLGGACNKSLEENILFKMSSLSSNNNNFSASNL